MTRQLPDSITWRVHLLSPREKVFELLATKEGRQQFWAEEAPEINGHIHFGFVNGIELRSKVIAEQPPERFELKYFGGSTVQFTLDDDGSGGTDLTMIESEIPPANLLDNLPGWISVLLALKGVADFSVDLRNHDPERTWDEGYVDV